MNSEQLLQLLNEIKSHIIEFKKNLRASERNYRWLINRSDDIRLNSILMERHLINIERQKECIARLETLRSRIEDELRRLRIDPEM